MPIYEHKCENCGQEWEGMYRMAQDVKEIACPNCEIIGQAKRLISLTAPGRVELTGHELTQQIKADAQKMKREARNNEKVYANMVGEEKYHKNKLANEKLENSLVKIGKDASKIKSTDIKPS